MFLRCFQRDGNAHQSCKYNKFETLGAKESATWVGLETDITKRERLDQCGRISRNNARLVTTFRPGGKVMTEERGEAVLTIPLSRIRPDPDQPRRFFDEAEGNRLADSISEYGLLQPIMVRPINDPSYDYIIVHGERRFRAHQQLGHETINALLWKKGESRVKDLQLIENVQRKDLSDIELAFEFKWRTEDGQTHGQIAEIIGKNRTYVTQRLGLLKLSEQDQQRMLHGDLTFSQARALLSVKTPELRQKISDKITSDLTSKQTLNIIKEETVSPKANVTRVTSAENVQVSELSVWAAIHDEEGHVRELIPRTKLIVAIVNDLKQLRETSA
jgi:ParB family transcriptional regulator, chromosome partitioning protein